jgi:hypothetical protein
MERRWIIAAWVFVVSLTYAVVRYMVFGSVPPSQLPVFLSNKAISVTALVMTGLSMVTNGSRRAALGAIGAALVLLHVVLSLIVLTPAYLGKLFDTRGTLTAAGEWSMLAGAIAGLIMVRLARRPSDEPGSGSLIPGAGQWILALTALHVLALGYPSWIDPVHWPGHLPPISMLSFLVAVGFLIARRRRDGERLRHNGVDVVESRLP